MMAMMNYTLPQLQVNLWHHPYLKLLVVGGKAAVCPMDHQYRHAAPQKGLFAPCCGHL